MAAPVTVEQIDQINSMIHDAERGDAAMKVLVGRRLVQIAGDLTRWQWVQHGDTSEYRQEACRHLVADGKFKSARRFALCGRADRVGLERETGTAELQHRGCGQRYCPRCSRRAGRRFVRKVTEVLEAGPHGPLFHIVLTQRAIVGEALEDTRARFEAAWKRMYNMLRRMGLVGGLCTYHLTRTGWRAWHWHLHLVAEFSGEATGEWVSVRVSKAWARARRVKKGEWQEGTFCRELCGAGDALVGMGKNRQMDFFEEAKGAVERVLQYAIRDILQGVERWVTNVRESEEVRVFVQTLSNCKMHRLLGRWRRGTAKAVEPEQGEPGASACKELKGKKTDLDIEWVGTVDAVLYYAHRGVSKMKAVSQLMRAWCRNSGGVTQRLCRVLSEL